MMLKVAAPAKINLTLEVLSKREDGYHEIQSIIQTIDLCDTLTLTRADRDSFTSDTAGWDGEKSLVSKAAVLFREMTGCSGGVSVFVEKRIPVSAGLGGDSSGAAAVLRGLNMLWKTGLPVEKLHGMAEKLGSDVPFFLYGGTALIEGRGEKVTPLPPAPRTMLVLAVPPVETMPGKTGQLFASLTPNHFTDGGITRRFVEALKNDSEMPPLFNTFENVAYTRFPGLGVWRDHFLKLGAAEVHLAGSGPVLFTVAKDRETAESLYAQLRKQNMKPVIAETVSAF